MRRIFFDYNFLNRGHQVYSYHSQVVIQSTRIIVNYETFLLRDLSDLRGLIYEGTHTIKGMEKNLCASVSLW